MIGNGCKIDNKVDEAEREIRHDKVNLRIAELKRKKNMTQEELARLVGVSFQTVSKWETGDSMPDIPLQEER